MITKRKQEAKHPFDAEMRVRVNKRIHPNVTSQQVKDFARRIVKDGKEIEGIEVKFYDVRGNDKAGDLLTLSDDYGFSTSNEFEISAKRVSSSKARKAKR